jgi:hypothetical protein
MKLYGVIPPMVTPFKESGDVDYNALEVLVRFLATNVDGLFVCGSYGSGPLMNMDERKEVATKSIEFAAGKVPLLFTRIGLFERGGSALSACGEHRSFGSERSGAILFSSQPERNY